MKLITNYINKQYKKVCQRPYIKFTINWITSTKNLLFLTLNLFISFLIGLITPELFCNDHTSKTPPINDNLIYYSFLVFLGIYVVIQFLPTKYFKQFYWQLLDTFLTGLIIIVIAISQSINTELVVHISNTNTVPNNKIITTDEAHNYHVDTDNYIEIEKSNQENMIVKTVYNEPVEVIVPK